ncbi:MAG: hypothetical protein ACRDJL_10640 [Actinomycetota bacterium]
MKRRFGLVLVLLSAISLFTSTTAYGEIVSTSGGIVKIAPPPSVMVGVLESDTEAFAFDEQQDVTLTDPLPVDITTPGVYDDSADLTPGSIPAGTTVSSHFVHADDIGGGGRSRPTRIEGTVVTDSDIIGISVLADNLDASDFLGAPGTVYPTGGQQRELNLDSADMVIEELDKRTVFIRFRILTHLDQVRIITEGEDEELGGEGCTPGYWKQPHHFDSWDGFAPTDSFEAVFGRDAYSGSPTLLDALEFKGGGLFALGRHSVAGLLNAAHPDVDYAFTSSQVIQMFQDAFDSGDAGVIEATKDALDAANNGGCTLN